MAPSNTISLPRPGRWRLIVAITSSQSSTVAIPSRVPIMIRIGVSFSGASLWNAKSGVKRWQPG